LAEGLRATDLPPAELIIPEAEEGIDDILRAIFAYSIGKLSIFIFGGGKNPILGVFF
jgi:hypothetical protein